MLLILVVLEYKDKTGHRWGRGMGEYIFVDFFTNALSE